MIEKIKGDAFIKKILKIFAKHYPFSYDDFHYLYYQFEESFDFLLQTVEYALEYNIALSEAARKIKVINFAERNNL